MLRLVDLSSSPDTDARAATLPGVVVAFGPAADLNRAEHWLNTATFTLTEDACTDLRVVTVDSVPDALAELTERCQRWPHASAVCDDVLRGVDPAQDVIAHGTGVRPALAAFRQLGQGVGHRIDGDHPKIGTGVFGQRESRCVQPVFGPIKVGGRAEGDHHARQCCCPGIGVRRTRQVDQPQHDHAEYLSISSFLYSLPVSVRGKVGSNAIDRGHLKCDRRFRSQPSSSSANSSLASAGWTVCTAAITRCPISSSGTPNTAASSTFG